MLLLFGLTIWSWVLQYQLVSFCLLHGDVHPTFIVSDILLSLSHVCSKKWGPSIRTSFLKVSITYPPKMENISNVIHTILNIFKDFLFAWKRVKLEAVRDWNNGVELALCFLHYVSNVFTALSSDILAPRWLIIFKRKSGLFDELKYLFAFVWLCKWNLLN